MLSVLRKHPRALVLSLVFHVALIGLIFINLNFADKPKHLKQGDVVKTVKAEVIDQNKLDAKKNQKEKKELEAKRKKEQAKKKKEQAKKKKEAEKKRKAEDLKKAEQKKKADAKKRKADDKKKAEVKRKAEDAKKAEAKRKVEATKKAEEKRKIEEKRKAEATKKAEEKRKVEEAKRKEEERKRQEAEKRRIAEAEQRLKEAELKAKLEAEENQRRLNSLQQEYILAIKQKIERYWLKPVGSGKMPVCEVYVTQGPGGIILNVTFGTCQGSTTYQTSIENAVYKAEPLPKPKDPSLFERELKFLFKPTE